MLRRTKRNGSRARGQDEVVSACHGGEIQGCGGASSCLLAYSTVDAVQVSEAAATRLRAHMGSDASSSDWGDTMQMIELDEALNEERKRR